MGQGRTPITAALMKCEADIEADVNRNMQMMTKKASYNARAISGKHKI